MKIDFKYHGKTIGVLNEGVFLKKVSSKKHKLRIFPAYGIQVGVFKHLEDDTPIIIEETHTGTRYRSLAKDWLKWGKKLNLGYGEQLFLAINKMEVV